MAKLKAKRAVPARELLRATWNKAWTKQWVQENTPFAVPRSLVYSETWPGLNNWLRGRSCPADSKMVVKPLNLSLSRGVRIISKEPGEDLYRDALGRTMDIVELSTDLQSDLPSSAAEFKWLVEEYVSPIPEKLLELTYDEPFNPLVRIIFKGGKFHAGEIKIPTRNSRGRGSLKGGARRVLVDWRGEAQPAYKPLQNDLAWNLTNYGTKIDLTGYKLPYFEQICEDLEKHVAQAMCPAGAFAIDGCYKQGLEAIQFVIIEIEHAPNIRHMLNSDEYRKPQ